MAYTVERNNDPQDDTAYDVMDSEGKCVGSIIRNELPNPRSQRPDVEWYLEAPRITGRKSIWSPTLRELKEVLATNLWG